MKTAGGWRGFSKRLWLFFRRRVNLSLIVTYINDPLAFRNLCSPTVFLKVTPRAVR